MSTALATVDVNSQEMIDQINAAHEACVGSFKTSLHYAITCGNLLREVRTRTPHGEWKTWVEENFAASERTAAVYMQVADAHHQNPALIEEADGSLQAAVGFISRKAGGGDLTLNDSEDDVVDAEVVPEPSYSLTLAQLTSLARKRWHRPPSEKEVLAWLKDANLA